MTDINTEKSPELWTESDWKLVLQVTDNVRVEVVDIMNQDIPFIWQEIYLKSALYLSHGVDDFMWGKATINMVEVSEGGSIWFSVKEKPWSKMNWLWHRKWQEELKERFGDQVARPDPDYRPEFNTF